MPRRPPSYEELQGAISDLLNAFATVDEQLDTWVAASTEGQTKDERREQRDACRTRDKAQKIWARSTRYRGLA